MPGKEGLCGGMNMGGLLMRMQENTHINVIIGSLLVPVGVQPADSRRQVCSLRISGLGSGDVDSVVDA